MFDTRKALEGIGFRIWDTGGGCQAYGLTFEDQSGYILITDDGGAEAPSEGDRRVLIGYYDAEGEQQTADELDIVDAMAMAMRTILNKETIAH